jgi:hypothetical protein
MEGEPVATITAPSRASETAAWAILTHLQEVFPGADGYIIEYERSSEAEPRFYVSHVGAPPFDCDQCETPHPGPVHLMRAIELDGETIPIGVSARTSITQPRAE